MGGDKPVDEDNGDYLGYGVYADTLWARVAQALNKDASGRDAQGRKTRLGDDPLVIGIFGEWGAGKSKLLSMVMQRTQQQSARDVSERILSATSGNPMTVTVPVYFQPWKYEHEPHLHVPLAVHVAEALNDTWKQLPTDIEKLKDVLTAAGETLEKATELAAAASDKLSKVKGFFDGALNALQSKAGAVVAGTTDVLLMSVGGPPLASVARKKIIGSYQTLADFGDELAERESDEPEDGGHEDSGASATAPAKRKSESPAKPDNPWDWKDDSLGFYRLHQRLQALTRPKLNQKLLEKAGIEVTPGIEFDLRINFVIFIDDLDRCLPEKAVETLELIKTVFNLESFAFVLALDEEVVERGIGHRYSAYTLAGKKPEMPITGFEYLEKIVHLPFRLPALSRSQAADMMRTYESRVLAPGRPDLWWFAAESPAAGEAVPAKPELAAVVHRKPSGEPSERADTSRGERSAKMELLPLVLESFDAYVPRKLIRLVELLHQVAAVMRERQRPLTWTPGRAGSPDSVDVRVVLAMLMLQLFQPELYRLMRRRVNAFPALLSAFAQTQVNPNHSLGNAALADMDLYRWCACESSLPHAVDADEPGAVSGADPITRIQKIAEPSTRALAQQVRLPMVELLVQYRAAQRHPFDALKLMQALARSMDETHSGPQALTAQRYWELLAANGSASALEGSLVDGVRLFASLTTPSATQGLADGRASARSVNAQKLFEELASTQTAIQANLAQNNGLEAGLVVPPDVAAQLLDWCERATEEQKERIVEGLPYLAPYLARDDGPKFAAYIAPAPEGLFDRKGPFDDKSQLAEAVAAADLRSALRLDERFNPQRFHLPSKRFNGHTDAQEPIEGFVRVPKGAFDMGAKGKGFEDNEPRSGFAISSDFYLARYLTTVDQFAHFVAANGYGEMADDKPLWWDTLGWEWRTGRWDSKVKDKEYREHLARRKPELRGAPMHWAEQQSHGSRPVMRLNWFEARAYANWLNGKLQAELNRKLPGYAVRLPTEALWERAARASDAISADDRQYPWGGADAKTAHRHANIGASDIGRPSPVGLFAPNPLGLCDLSGNLWEWQNNLYQPSGEGQAKGLNADVHALKTHDEPDQCDRPALRGGAWDGPADYARASIRSWVLPDVWLDFVGFRVVLSLAE